MSEHIIETKTFASFAFVPIGGTANLREEIVRCRDCRHYEGVLCTNGFIDGNPDAFCSWGERRDV